MEGSSRKYVTVQTISLYAVGGCIGMPLINSYRCTNQNRKLIYALRNGILLCNVTDWFKLYLVRSTKLLNCHVSNCSIRLVHHINYNRQIKSEHFESWILLLSSGKKWRQETGNVYVGSSGLTSISLGLFPPFFAAYYGSKLKRTLVTVGNSSVDKESAFKSQITTNLW